MQTRLAAFIRDTPAGKEADAILRACVHCGFCTAACPTYQLTGDELDGPRGRIYLVKQMLETGRAGQVTLHHLDRCLLCRSCETTCPSGVRYARLAEIGREVAEGLSPRPLVERIKRRALRWVVPEPKRLKPLLTTAQHFYGLLPESLATRIPLCGPAAHPSQCSGPQLRCVLRPAGWSPNPYPTRGEGSKKDSPSPSRGEGCAAARVRVGASTPNRQHTRTMLILEGCVQSVVTPDVNAAARRLFDCLGITLIAAPEAGCCGALDSHLSAREAGRKHMRRNIDAWWPHIEAGAEAILVTASGCGVMVKEYGAALRDDPRYADKARRVAELARDPCEVLTADDLIRLGIDGRGRRIAFQSPCSLQHGQKLGGRIEALLHAVDFELTPVADGHLCCGSAGSYSVLQPEMSEALRDKKLAALKAGKPEMVATANIGCQMHLAAASNLQVKHWLEILAAHPGA